MYYNKNSLEVMQKQAIKRCTIQIQKYLFIRQSTAEYYSPTIAIAGILGHEMLHVDSLRKAFITPDNVTTRQHLRSPSILYLRLI